MSVLFPLSTDEQERLRRLNQDKAVMFALKKLFLNTCFDKPVSSDVNSLAAERVAQEYIKKAFREIDNIHADSPNSATNENMI